MPYNIFSILILNSFLDSSTDEEKLIGILRTKEYTKIHIDENCIVGWATRYYSENSSATKSDFIGDTTGRIQIVGEIRRPTKFVEFIYPYEKKSNERFRYLMDRLNDFLQKKDLGAFYTHELYAKKSLELVRDAIRRVPQGNDYVIIDRCAGTGNLERLMTKEELSHTIVSTLEYYELLLSGKKRQNHIFSTNITSYTCFTKKGLSFEAM